MWASAAAALLVAVAPHGGGAWTRFGYDAARHDAGPAVTGITAANVRRLKRQRVALDGTVDSSPIYANGLFVVTTSYGKTIAIDAASGRIRWRFTPPGYDSWAGSYRITNATPLADPAGGFVYAAAPDGRIYKLALATGRQLWSVSITRKPEREKLGTALNLSRGLVLATTGGYIGDAPPYQGHVAAIDAASGRLVHVWNALCSDRHELLDPASCRESGAAIWARSGAVVDPRTGDVLVTTGNGRFDRRTNWGDSVLELSPDAGRLLRSFTPPNQAELDSGDVDLGSSAPASLPGGFWAQAGKDAQLRLLDSGLRQRQALRTPGGGGLFSAPAESGSLLFVADSGATAAYRVSGGRLHIVWRQSFSGTSPVLAGGLLYVYDPSGGVLRVLRPQSGALVAELAAGPGHWNSPIAIDGRIALPEGDANQHRTTGVLDIWRLP